MSDWVSVEKGLPEDGYIYDVWIKSTKRSGYGRRKTDVTYDKGFQVDFYAECEYVSHYMSIPKRPG